MNKLKLTNSITSSLQHSISPTCCLFTRTAYPKSRILLRLYGDKQPHCLTPLTRLTYSHTPKRRTSTLLVNKKGVSTYWQISYNAYLYKCPTCLGYNNNLLRAWVGSAIIFSFAIFLIDSLKSLVKVKLIKSLTMDSKAWKGSGVQ